MASSPERGNGDPLDEIAQLANHLKMTALTTDEIGKLLERAERSQLSYSNLALELVVSHR